MRPCHRRRGIDAHDIYMYSRERKIHRHPVTLDQPDVDARAALRAVAAARARESVRIPAEPAADGAQLPAGACATRQADTGAAGASDGEGRRDRAGRPRFPAVLREQGRLGRRIEAVPADVRSRVPVAGTDSRARSGRAASARRRAPNAGGARARTSRCSSGCCANGRFRRRASSTGCPRARAS